MIAPSAYKDTVRDAPDLTTKTQQLEQVESIEYQ